MTSNIEALRVALAAGHWYCLSAAGQAMLCVNEEDARNEAEECDCLYPQHAPHRAVQLVPAAPDLLAEVDRLKAEREALRAQLAELRPGGQDRHISDPEMRPAIERLKQRLLTDPAFAAIMVAAMKEPTA